MHSYTLTELKWQCLARFEKKNSTLKNDMVTKNTFETDWGVGAHQLHFLFFSPVPHFHYIFDF
jgi:hypothetical protein